MRYKILTVLLLLIASSAHAQQTSGVSLPLLAQGSATANQGQLLVGCAAATAAPTFTTGNTYPLPCTTTGLVRVDASATAIQGGTVGSAAPSAANNVMVGVLDSSSNVANLSLIGAQGGPLEAQPADNTTGSTLLQASGNAIGLALEGERGAVFQLQAAGTGVYTVTPQCSYDGAVSYNTNGIIIDPISGATSLTATIASAQAETDYPVLCPSGSSHVQMKVTAFTSGSASWLARATTLSPISVVYGSDGTNIRALLTGTGGKLLVTPDSVALPANQSVNLSQVAGTTTSTGNGTTNAGDIRVNVASDNTAFAVNAQPAPVTSGGLSTFTIQAAASDNHTNVKNGAGQVYHIAVQSIAAGANYLRLYNAATGFNGCNSATNLVWDTVIPAQTTGAGYTEDIAMGLTFSTGISICITGGFANNDTTTATASAIKVNIGYK